MSVNEYSTYIKRNNMLNRNWSHVGRQVQPLFDRGIPRSGFQRFQCETNTRTAAWHRGNHRLCGTQRIKTSHQPPMLGVKVTVLTPKGDYEGSSEYCRRAAELSSQEWRENLQGLAGFPRVSMLVPWWVSVTADDKVFFCPACANSAGTRRPSRGGGGGEAGIWEPLYASSISQPGNLWLVSSGKYFSSQPSKLQ
jgi:hypothetical protein